jgi:hypothetical protein
MWLARNERQTVTKAHPAADNQMRSTTEADEAKLKMGTRLLKLIGLAYSWTLERSVEIMWLRHCKGKKDVVARAKFSNDGHMPASES